MKVRKGEERKQKVEKPKCGSCVLPGSFVNTLQTVFVAAYFLSLRNSLCMTSTLFGVLCVFVRTSACEIFIYRLCPW